RLQTRARRPARARVQTCAPIRPVVQVHETEAPGAHTFPFPPPPLHPTMTATSIATPIVDRSIPFALQLPALGRPQAAASLSVSRRRRGRRRRVLFSAHVCTASV